MATDIPDPTPLDEALWSLYLATRAVQDPALVAIAAKIAGGAKALFPHRYRRVLREANPGGCAASRRAWREAHPDYDKDRRAADPEGYRARARVWSRAFALRHGAPTTAAYERGRYARHRVEILERQRARYAAKKAAAT